MSEQDDFTLPLVSIIIRSMDRPTLADALNSVALLTYSNIEVIVINAKGATHSELSNKCGCFPLRLIENDEQLSRSRAANIGLQAATGKYLIFLDDDDLLYPEHITTLVSALKNEESFRCAYAGVRVEYYVNGQLETSSVYSEAYDQRRLWGRNFIPIHAVLFERSLVTSGCAFDENLEFFEDWDFWVQITQHTAMLHVDEVGAVYRNFGNSGLGLEQDENAVRELRGKFFKKWKKLLTDEQLDDLIQYREEIITELRSQSFHINNQLADMRNQLTDMRNQLTDMRSQLTHSSILITTLQNQQNRLMQEAFASTAREKALHQTITNLVHSTSWKITGPVRFLSRICRGQHREALAGVRRRLTPLLKIIYWRIPAAWRNTVLTTAYKTAGPFFTGTGHYEAWQANKKYSGQYLPATTQGFLAELVDIQDFIPVKSNSPGRIAIHVHIFYPDLATEFAKYLRNMPFSYDLFVSTPNESAKNLCEQAFSNLPKLEQLTVTITPNRGRDIAPMLCTFGESLLTYDYIAHIHSKKSLYNKGATDGWREYLLTSLLGSKSQICKIFTLLTGEVNAGIVYPQNFSNLPYSAYTWLSNQANGRVWCNKLGITNFPTGYFDFPAGSMFWAKTEALRPLFDAGIDIEDFAEEAGQNDATLAHCLERLLVLTTKQFGFNAIILRDAQSISWSRWRFDQYLARKPEIVQSMLADHSVHVIIFDIFDTLLTRPLLNPEQIKSIIAKQAGGKTGDKYLELRAAAESQARQKAGHDIGLDAIFEELATLSGLSPENVARLRQLEEATELEAVAPRPEAIALLQLAMSLGKRVLLASDMYLPKTIVEEMLRKHGITAWHQLYLSSDIGLRKDTGDLYHHIFAQEDVAPEVVMIFGDNEHSDVQIPGDLGASCLHVLRPVELARAIPRLGPLVEPSIYQNDLNVQLTLGTIVRENYQPIFYPQFNPADIFPATPWSIGFSIVGPLVLSFIQWLTSKALADGMQHLYFLAREGQILKMVYDRWFSNDTNTIASDYLVLSRRTVAVPMIKNFEDILEIARVQFSPNDLSTFIQERYGLILSQTECDEFTKQKLWPKNKLVSVENQDIDHLIPLLQALEDRIMTQVQDERPALLAYMNDLGFNSTTTPSAIVDIGYAATIQGRLNHLLNQSTHGYYLITEERAQKVSSQYGVITQGCFGHHVDAFINPPLMFRKSFSLEQLLSSDDAQIVRYRVSDTDDILPEFRNITEAERQAMATRKEIRRGIMDFVDQSITIRDKLADDFTVPPDLAKTLFETFIEHPSHSEQAILSKLMLDDYYCGRGLVN